MTKRNSDDLQTMDSNSTTTTDVLLTTNTTNGLNADLNENNININENNNEITKKVKLNEDLNNDSINGNQRNGPQMMTTTASTTIPIKSRVVHVRNIPVDTTDADLIGLAMTFGRVTNCLILRGKSQAFVEFSESQSAQQMVNYWLQTTVAGIATQLQPTIRGRHVFCQLSNHKELKTNNNHVMQNNNNNNHSMMGSDNHNITTQSQPHDTSSSSPSCVIRVVVENLLYSVSLEILHSVFSRAGKVAKIVTFTKNGSFQALIQFQESSSAIQAKHLLDGQNLFHSANTLRIEFSKLQQLNVKYNNDKSRDYTNPSLPSNQGIHQGLDQESLMNSILSGGVGSGGQHHIPGGHNTTAQQLFGNPFAVNQSQVNALRALNPLHALQQLGAQGLQTMNALGLGAGLGASPNGMQSSVLLVSNLNESTTTTDALFTLFGVYGDVIRVKILFNKKDNALIQMAEPQQSQLAQTYLDKIKLSGRVIRVTQSKHQLVQMPKEGQHDAGLTKDYSSSALHRFKKPGSKNYGNIYPPSATLHLSNIPSCVSEEDIRSAFSRETQCSVVAFKFFPKDRKMALIQLQSIDDAIQALIAMHNYQLSESSHLRVSFSKSSI